MSAVVVPWQPGCPHREAIWKTLRERHATEDREVYEARYDGPGWCKAAAIAPTIATLTEDIVVIADADVWTDGLANAIAAVERGAPWAIPHTKVYRLTASVSERWLTGEPVDLARRAYLEERPYRGWAGGGIVVLPRATWDDCPIDPRFTGWGQEDAAWACALNTLHGAPWRGDADLIHLWHPPQPRRSRRMGTAEGFALFRRYKLAERRPDAMRALIAEHSEVRHAR